MVPSVCFFMLFFASPHTWRIFASMFWWTIFLYVWYRWVHLRFNKMAFYTTHRLDVTVNFFWGLPLSIVAAAWAHWGVRSGCFASIWWIPTSFFISLLAWVMCYWQINPYHLQVQEEQVHKTYEQVQEQTLYSWFNVNPIFVLKCSFCPEKVEGHGLATGAGDQNNRILFFEIGKVYR